jgi:hypothetical protein
VEVTVYVAVIADIVASRSIPERYALQEALKATLVMVNERYALPLASPFTLTLGDEFQGLLHAVDGLFEMLDFIRFRHEEVVFRFGIGLGRILTAIDPRSSLGADGPAYWHARSALECVHRRHDYRCTNMRIEADDAFNINDIAMANEVLRLCGFIEKRWRPSQRAFVRDYIRRNGHVLYGVSQKSLAEALGISPQQYNQSIRLSGLHQYLGAKGRLDENLQRALWKAQGNA